MSTVTELVDQPGVFGFSRSVRVYDTLGAASNVHRVLVPLFNQWGEPFYGTQDSGGPGGARRNILDLDQYEIALQALKDYTDPWGDAWPVIGDAGAPLVGGWDNIAAVLGITLS